MDSVEDVVIMVANQSRLPHGVRGSESPGRIRLSRTLFALPIIFGDDRLVPVDSMIFSPLLVHCKILPHRFSRSLIKQTPLIFRVYSHAFDDENRIILFTHEKQIYLPGIHPTYFRPCGVSCSIRPSGVRRLLFATPSSMLPCASQCCV